MPGVGQQIPHDSAIGHVTGTSEYVSDIAKMQQELIVDFYYSNTTHGEILSINLEEACKIPGIVALYTYKDIPGINKFGAITPDEMLLAENIIEYAGQPIVIIAGETYKAVKQAKKVITVDIKKLQPVLTIEEAIEKNQYIGPQRTIESGDIKSEFAKPDLKILEGTFCSSGQEHLYLESQSSIVYPGENNTIKVISATQNPTEVQTALTEILGISSSSIVVETKRVGGAFGGKENQATHPAAMAAIVAMKTKRSARIRLSMEDDMMTTGKRHAYLNKYKAAFTKEGKIKALDIEFYSNGGYANDVSTSILERTMLNAENAYYIPNIRIKGRICKTNYAPNTAFRGFGAPQAVINIESLIEDIAISLKKEPFEIRKLNCYDIEANNTTPYGQILENNTLPELFDKLIETSNYNDRLKKVIEHNKNSTLTLRGISFIPIKYGLAFTAKFLNQASALVNIYTDGSIQVSTGGIEMGQGLNTKIRQIVADEFHINPELVRMMTTSTEKNNNTSPTAGSTGTDLNGSAALDACRKLKQRLIEFAAQYLSAGKGLSVSNIEWNDSGIFDIKNPEKIIPFKKLVFQAYLNRINLGERGFYATPRIDFNPDTGKGCPFAYYTNGCAVSEVEIDKFTGQVRVLRTDILMDIGQSINPGIDRGQMAGAFVQGLGWLTTEELKYSDKGVLLSNSAATYKIPTFQDIPEILNIDWIENNTNTMNIRRSKGIGEPPLLFGISVWTAIKQALSCISGGEIINLKAPATSEEILNQISYYLNKARVNI